MTKKPKHCQQASDADQPADTDPRACIQELWATILDGDGCVMGLLEPRGPHGLRLFRDPPAWSTGSIEDLNWQLTVRCGTVLRTGLGLWVGFLAPELAVIQARRGTGIPPGG